MDKFLEPTKEIKVDLHEIYNSQHKQLCRSHIDTVDHIHSQGLNDLEFMLNKIRNRMQKWDLAKNEPVDIELTMLKTIDMVEKELEKRNWLAHGGPSAEIYDISKYKEELQKLRELCLQQKLDTKILDSHEVRKSLPKRFLIDELAHGTKQPFMYYKQTGQLDRTFQKCQLSREDKEDDREKLAKIIKEHKKSNRKIKVRQKPSISLTASKKFVPPNYLSRVKLGDSLNSSVNMRDNPFDMFSTDYDEQPNLRERVETKCQNFLPDSEQNQLRVSLKHRFNRDIFNHTKKNIGFPRLDNRENIKNIQTVLNSIDITGQFNSRSPQNISDLHGKSFETSRRSNKILNRQNNSIFINSVKAGDSLQYFLKQVMSPRNQNRSEVPKTFTEGRTYNQSVNQSIDNIVNLCDKFN